MRGINHAEDFGWAAAPRFGSESTPSTTTSSSAPWSGQQPYLSSLFGQAQNLATNYQPQYYSGGTYAPLNNQQNYLANIAEGRGAAGGGGALQAANNTAFNTQQAPYTADTQGTFNAANPTLASIASGTPLQATEGAFNTGQNYLNGLLNNTSNPNAAFNAANPQLAAIQQGAALQGSQGAYNQGQNYLSSMLSGAPKDPTQFAGFSGLTDPSNGYLSNMLSGATLDPGSAPGFQSLVNRTMASVLPATDAAFIKSGRSDSGLATAARSSALSDSIGNLGLNYYLGQQQLQDSAAKQLGSNQANALNYYTGQQQLQSNAAQQAAANQATGLNATLGAGGLSSTNSLGQQGIFNAAAGQTAANQATGLNATLGASGLASSNLLNQQGNQIKAAGIAPIIDQAQQQNLTTGLSAAGLGQQDSQNLINADIQRFNFNQMQPWNTAGMYQGLVNGNYGSQGTSTTPYYQNTAANVLGGVATAGGLFAPNADAGGGFKSSILGSIFNSIFGK
jgi:hypothetical protein